jgi:hypothetical protein
MTEKNRKIKTLIKEIDDSKQELERKEKEKIK